MPHETHVLDSVISDRSLSEKKTFDSLSRDLLRSLSCQMKDRSGSSVLLRSLLPAKSTATTESWLPISHISYYVTEVRRGDHINECLLGAAELTRKTAAAKSCVDVWVWYGWLIGWILFISKPEERRANDATEHSVSN